MRKRQFVILALTALAAAHCAPIPAADTNAAGPSSASRPADADSLDIPAPVIPDRTFLITAYGAVGDGKTLNTSFIQKTIAACSAAGGGRVEIPAGVFLTAPITLASNLDLHVDPGATLLISGNQAVFASDQRGFGDCIRISNGHDISITGSGTIDGQGKYWWPLYRKQPGSPASSTEPSMPQPQRPNPATLPHRPFLVVFSNCRRVLVRDVLLQNSPMFNLVPQRCRDVVIDNVRIQDPFNSPNTDGIDPSGWNFLITRCHIDVGDDCIALKPSAITSAAEALKPSPDSLSCENFLISHCDFVHGHGMSIGNPSPGGARNITVRDCTFDGTDAGIRMKSHRGTGGIVENLTYENLTMKNVKVAILITSYYPEIPKAPENDPAQPDGPGTPVWRHIRISNLTAAGGMQAARIIGLAEMPISDIVLDHVNISAKLGMQIVHATGIIFSNSQVTAATGPILIEHDAQVSGLDTAAH
jgi:polygalacturonase